MTKTIIVDPVAARRHVTVDLGSIPINVYARTIEEERASLGDDRLLRILRDMMVVREFEMLLDRLKRGQSYAGVRYDHLGPAHLSIGQEASAVGQAVYLRPEDHIYGSHRSHGEIIAKGLAAIEALDEPELQSIMESYLDGETLRPIEQHLKAAEFRTRAVQFLLYGLLAEIFGRAAGFNRGMGGSMHAFFPPFGSYPNNAIVGGSGPIATGGALFKKLRRQPGIVIANVGDGSTGTGTMWEAMNFAAMTQFFNLWPEEYQGGLPIIFSFMNNFYAMGGQTVGETMGYDHLSRIGAGINPANMHAETVDGNNPLAVADAVRRKRQTLEAGNGPVLLDVQCYRQSGHSPSDASSYRSPEEVEAWRAVDPIAEYEHTLREAGILGDAAREQLAQWASDRVGEICRLAADLEISPRLDLERDPDAIGRLMFSHKVHDLPPDPVGQTAIPLDHSTRLGQIANLARFGLDAEGTRLPPTKAVTVRDALFEVIAHHFAHDPSLVAYGEENRDWGGAFAVYRGLTDLLPYNRLFNAPISEAAIVGTAVGYALEGGRALIELMYADFMGRAGDELFNQLAKWHAMSGGTLAMPVVVRVSVGNKYGAQHSQEWSALPAHIAGLKVVYPATPYDAKGLMASALSGDDPVIFFESQRLYDTTEIFHEGGVPREYYRIPIGEPDIKRSGSDVTILSIGAPLYRAMEAAHRLARDFGLEAEVIDARSLVPFDYEPVLQSIRKTGRIVLTSDACERASYLANLAAEIGEMAFDDLDGPVTLVAARNWIAPPTEMEQFYVPQPEWILDAIHTYLVPLPRYVPTTDRSAGARRRRARLGV